MPETWKPVVGYEGLYEVSNFGRVRSLDREGVFKGRWGEVCMRFPGKEMRISRARSGYCYLSLSRGAISTKHLLHRLVLAAFAGPSDLQVNHKNGDKEDNRLANLEYCTSQENLLHCTRVLKKKIGEGNGCAKLKTADIPKIRADSRSLKAIARDYGVTHQAIYLVKKGKNWGHVS